MMIGLKGQHACPIDHGRSVWPNLADALLARLLVQVSERAPKPACTPAMCIESAGKFETKLETLCGANPACYWTTSSLTFATPLPTMPNASAAEYETSTTRPGT